jgi:hypothetical protein
MNHQAIRRACGWSITKTAAVADVGPGLVRIYELDPSAVKDERKREGLRRVYAALRVCAGRSAES